MSNPICHELLAALEDLVERCDGEEGVREDGSNIQTMRAHAAIEEWRRVTGWTEAYEKALEVGFSLADARDMADREAAYNMRTER